MHVFKPENPVEKFLLLVHEAYGLFLDGSSAFPGFAEVLFKDRPNSMKKLEMSAEELDNTEFFYGNGNPNTPETLLQHHATQREVRERNERNGLNTGLLGNFILVMIYSYWDDHFREEVALITGLEKREDLKINVLGDIRHLRNAIVHNRGVATSECETKTIDLKFFKHGDQILIESKIMGQIIESLINAMKPLEDTSGVKLFYRNIFTSRRGHRSIFDV